MNNKVQMGYSEAAAVVLMFMGTKAFLGLPRAITTAGGTAGWLVLTISGILTIILWLFVVSLLKKFPGKSIIYITEDLLGPLLGLIVNIIFLGYILISTSLLLRIFGEAVDLTALTETPISALTLVLIICAAVGAYLGIEAISRNAFISLPFILAGVSLVLLLLYPYYDLKHLLPIMGKGPLKLAVNGMLGISGFGEVILLAFIVPCFSFDYQRLKYIGIFSILFSMIFFIWIVCIFLMVFPLPTDSEVVAPFFQLSRSIYLGYYFQRLEALFVIFWTYSAFLRLSIGLCVTAIVFREIFAIPYYRPLLPSLCLLIFSLALTPENAVQAIMIENNVRTFYGMIISFLLPVILWFIAVITKKGENGNEKKEQG